MPEAKRAAPRSASKASSALQDQVHEMQVYGSVPSDFLSIVSTGTTLFCGLGRANDAQALVPYLQIRFLKSEAEDEENAADESNWTSAFQGTMALENAGFMLMDLARDFRAACRHLVTLSSGGVKPERLRLAYTLECLKRGRTFLDNAIAHLEPLAVDTAPAPKPRPTRRARATPVTTKGSKPRQA